MKAVSPEENKTLWDMCVFIAQHARKEIIHPIRIFNQDCLNAAVFKTLKKNLCERGVKAEGIRPSTSLSLFLNNDNFPYVLAEIILTGVKTFEFLKSRLRNDISFWRKINLFDPDRCYFDTGSIRTFGDLARKISENLPQEK